jgi:arylsulfatase A-like enzyme
MLAQLDDGIGRVLAQLQELGLAENTLVVFLSDNGGPTRELTSSNRPLRGEKGQLLEGGVRVPLILRWPARIPAGRTDSRLVSALDLLPTALAAAGAKPPANLDGVDLLPHLSGEAEKPVRAAHYWRVGGRAAYREGDWKIHRASAGGAWQLFNLREDISEERDRAAAEPARARTLEAAWKALDAQMAPPRWGGPGSRGKGRPK